MTDKSNGHLPQLLLSLLSLTALLALMHVLGELHGMITTVIILGSSTALNLTRMALLQRELARVRQIPGNSNIINEADETW